MRYTYTKTSPTWHRVSLPGRVFFARTRAEVFAKVRAYEERHKEIAAQEQAAALAFTDLRRGTAK